MRWKCGLTAALVLCAVLLASCNLGFFANSMGKDLARDPSTITVTAKNVDALLKESRGDPKASKGILDNIAEQLKNNPNPDPKLQAAAVTAANQAAGLGELVLENIGTVLEDPENVSYENLLDEVLKSADEKDIKGVSEQITASLGRAVTSGNPPKFTGNFIDGVSGADLTQLAFTLILAEASGDVNTYVDDWGSGKKLDGTGLSSSERLIAAIANELAGRKDNKMGNQLKEFLGDDE
ncbi:MAG: hypothetical protein LBP20_05200 [Treponema sp.]|jgi:predicted small secreted protein|nr:hypothetical protein [Treponema sp.]